MSKTAAKRQAHKESSIYRQGSGWIISTWDDAFGCNTLSNELSHSREARGLADWRIERANFLLSI